MKFPYGISDFSKVIPGGYFYADRVTNLRLYTDGVVVIGFERLVWSEV